MLKYRNSKTYRNSYTYRGSESTFIQDTSEIASWSVLASENSSFSKKNPIVNTWSSSNNQQNGGFDTGWTG